MGLTGSHNDNKKCPLCGKDGKLKSRHGIYYKCNVCDLEWLNSKYYSVESVNYVSVLNTITKLRIANNKRILDTLVQIMPQGAEGLEVGSAVGLFMESAEACGYKMHGIEPMEESYLISKNKGLNVTKGYFPVDMPQKKQYDFIIFNDAFEHIPKIKEVVEACKEYLRPNGYLVINLPDSNGAIYNMSRILDFFGESDELYRMWQIKTDSPHLYYFNKKSLDILCKSMGFTKVCNSIKLKSFECEGIENRVNAMPINQFKAHLLAIGLRLLYPLIQILPSDTICHIYRKQ